MCNLYLMYYTRAPDANSPVTSSVSPGFKICMDEEIRRMSDLIPADSSAKKSKEEPMSYSNVNEGAQDEIEFVPLKAKKQGAYPPLNPYGGGLTNMQPRQIYVPAQQQQQMPQQQMPQQPSFAQYGSYQGMQPQQPAYPSFPQQPQYGYPVMGPSAYDTNSQGYGQDPSAGGGGGGTFFRENLPGAGNNGILPPYQPLGPHLPKQKAKEETEDKSTSVTTAATTVTTKAPRRRKPIKSIHGVQGWHRWISSSCLHDVLRSVDLSECSFFHPNFVALL